MQEIFDTYCNDKRKQVITFKEHGVPGLKNFAHHNNTTSIDAIPFHYHSDAIEIHCMIKGERVVYLTEETGISHHIVYGNELFITMPYEIHQNGDSSQSPCEYYAFQIDLSDCDKLLGLNKEYSNFLASSLLSIKNRHLSLSAMDIALIRKSFKFISSNDPDNIKISVQLLSCFLFNLSYMEPVEVNCNNAEDENINNAIKYISENISNALTLENIAKVSGYSLSHFKNKFKNEIGIPPAEYIALEKIKYAKKLLETTDMSIMDISLDLGFSSSNYFAFVFKKMLNITPQQYKKKFKHTPRQLNNTRNADKNQ